MFLSPRRSRISVFPLTRRQIRFSVIRRLPLFQSLLNVKSPSVSLFRGNSLMKPLFLLFGLMSMFRIKVMELLFRFIRVINGGPKTL